MYDVEVTIRRNRPLCVPQVGSEQTVREIIESALAAWGIPFPASLRDSPDSAFTARLAATGSYRHAEGDASISVKRAI